MHPARLLAVATAGAFEQPRFILFPVMALLIVAAQCAWGFDDIQFPLGGGVHSNLGFLDEDRRRLVPACPAGDRLLAVSHLLRCSSMVLEALAVAPTFC